MHLVSGHHAWALRAVVASHLLKHCASLIASANLAYQATDDQFLEAQQARLLTSGRDGAYQEACFPTARVKYDRFCG